MAKDPMSQARGYVDRFKKQASGIVRGAGNIISGATKSLSQPVSHGPRGQIGRSIPQLNVVKPMQSIVRPSPSPAYASSRPQVLGAQTSNKFVGGLVGGAIGGVKPAAKKFYQGFTDPVESPYRDYNSAAYSTGRFLGVGAPGVTSVVGGGSRLVNGVVKLAREATAFPIFAQQAERSGESTVEANRKTGVYKKLSPQQQKTQDELMRLSGNTGFAMTFGGFLGGGRPGKGKSIQFNPNEKEVMRNFAYKVDQLGSKANKANLGDFGAEASLLVEKYFGKKYVDLPNTKIAKLFDYALAKREGGLVIKPKGVQIPAGLSAQESEGLAQQALTQKGLQTKIPGQSTSQVPGAKNLTKTVSSLDDFTTNVPNPQDPYFNINKLKVPKETKQALTTVIKDTKPEIERVVGKKLSGKEVLDVANNSAQTIRKAISREETLAWEAKMLRARQLLAEQAKQGTVTKEYIDNLLAIKSQGTDIARRLQSLSIGADPKAITAKQAILEAVLKASDNADDVIAASKGVDFNDLKQSTAFYRKFIKPSSEDWITLLRYNSMLSSPNTHIVNTASNFQGVGIIAPIEKTVLGGVDFLKSKITGSERQYFAGEGKEYAIGALSKIRDASHAFADVMRGKNMIANPDVRSIPLTTGGKAAKVEKVLSYPLRLLEGADQFFQTLAKGGAERSLKYRASKGVKVPNIDIQSSEEAAKRLFRSDINLKEQGTVLNAIDQVTQTVFSLRNNENTIVRTLAKFTFPFVKTPMNILKQGVEYSPLGFSTLKGATNKTEQFTKALMGTSIGMGSAMLLGSDRISWSEPTNATQRDNFRAAGLQPYAVKIGDKWVSYSKLHPAIAFNLAMFAALSDAQKNQGLEDSEVETVLTGLAKWWGFFADQSYVKNIGDFVASSKGDLEGAARYISNYPQQLIPFRALMGWVTRLVDPNQRKVDPDGSILEKQLQQVATQIPGLSSKIPARVDRLGNPIEQQNPLINAFSPNRVTTEDPMAKSYFQSRIEESKANKDVTRVNEIKKEIYEMYLSGDQEGARELNQKNELHVTKKDLKKYQTQQKNNALDEYIIGNKEGYNQIKTKYNLSITRRDLNKRVKSRQVSLYKKYLDTKNEYYLNEYKRLKEEYGITLTVRDIK